MTDVKTSREEAQAEIDGLLVAEIIRDAQVNFRGVYDHYVFSLGVGPIQSLIGLAIKRGHLSVAALQAAAAEAEGRKDE